jgi:hypothetical protein
MKRRSILCAMGLVACTAGCGSPCAAAAPGAGGCLEATTCADARDRASSLALPTSRSTFALDMNGDGKPDNQLGEIMVALAAHQLDLQAVDDALANGRLVVELEQIGADLENAPCSVVLLSFGGAVAGHLDGTVGNGRFNSNSPASGSANTEAHLTLSLAIVDGAAPIAIPVHGGHVQFTRAAGQLMNGQLNGVVASSDVQGSVLAAIAQSLTARYDPRWGALFDDGGQPQAGDGCVEASGASTCRSHAAGAPDFGQCAHANDGIIATCELATNAWLAPALAPDVQMFQGGDYRPSAANTARDSLSFGLAFTAVDSPR